MINESSSEIVVSVVCLAYNHEKYIESAFSGFLSQKTPFEVEFIVAEDCSTDRTLDIINQYRDRFNGRLRVVENKSNLGFMKNLINAMSLAQGKYIAICEGDDYWVDPNKLMVQVSKMEDLPSVDLSFHSSYIEHEHEHGELGGLFCKRANGDSVFGLKDVVRSAGSFMPTASMMIRNDAYKSLSLAVRELYAGYTTAFFTQMIFSFRGGSLYIDRPMSVYRSMSAGSWTESIVKDFDVYIYWSEKYLGAIKGYDKLTNYKYRWLFRGAVADKHFSILKHSAASIEYKKEYFSENKFELKFWQRLAWGGIRCFPQGIFILRKGKVRLARLREELRSFLGGK